jgi:hypothetical protein
MSDLLVAPVQIWRNDDRVPGVGVVVLEDDQGALDLDLDRGTISVVCRTAPLDLSACR